MKLELSAAMPVGAAMRYILARQFYKLRASEDAARASENVKAIHAMRVACRRMKSAFRFGRAYLPQKQLTPEFPMLEALRDTLGAARNLDVLQGALQTYRARVSEPERAALHGLAEAWRSARAERQTALIQLLSGRAYAEWAERIEAFLEQTASETELRVADEIPARLWKQYGIVRAYEPRLERAALPTLHALRIAVKRLRYALEFFSEPLAAPQRAAPQPQELIDALIALQDRLGEMQDAVVGGEFVTQYLVAQAERAARGERAESIIYPAEFHALTNYQNELRVQIQTRRAQTPPFYAALVSAWFRDSLGTLTARL